MNRAHTSEYQGKDLRRPDRRTAMKVLVDKTFSFVTVVWTAYVAKNKVDIRYVTCTQFCMNMLIYFAATARPIEDEPSEVPSTQEEVLDGTAPPPEESDDDEED